MTARTFRIVKPIVWILGVAACVWFWLFVIKAVF